MDDRPYEFERGVKTDAERVRAHHERAEKFAQLGLAALSAGKLGEAVGHFESAASAVRSKQAALRFQEQAKPIEERDTVPGVVPEREGSDAG